MTSCEESLANQKIYHEHWFGENDYKITRITDHKHAAFKVWQDVNEKRNKEDSAS